MKEFFLQMLDSRDPSVSSGRFLSVLTVMLILYTWMWVSFYLQQIQDIPIGVYTFAGLVIAGKTVGMFAEQPKVNTTTTIETSSRSKTEDTKDADRRDSDRQDLDRRA